MLPGCPAQSQAERAGAGEDDWGGEVRFGGFALGSPHNNLGYANAYTHAAQAEDARCPAATQDAANLGLDTNSTGDCVSDVCCSCGFAVETATDFTARCGVPGG